MMDGRAEGVQVFAPEGGRSRSSPRITGHPKLAHKRVIHLTGHPASRLLPAKERAQKRRATSGSAKVLASGAFTSKIRSN